MEGIKISEDFYSRLANRNERQGDGTHNAIEFRNKYLKQCENQDFWKSDETIIFDFSGVEKIGPSFANEAFAYFLKYTDPKTLKAKIKFINISKVQLFIIDEEIQSGYSHK